MFFPHHPQDRMIRHIFEFPYQIGKQPRPFANDLLQVARYLSPHREQDVGVLVQLFCKKLRRHFGRWLEIAALDLAQIGRFIPDALRYLAERETSVLASAALAIFTDVLTKMCHDYYISYACRDVSPRSMA